MGRSVRATAQTPQACPERAKRVEWIPPLARVARSVGMTKRRRRGRDDVEAIQCLGNGQGRDWSRPYSTMNRSTCRGGINAALMWCGRDARTT